jgi:hypothetical protein
MLELGQKLGGDLLENIQKKNMENDNSLFEKRSLYVVILPFTIRTVQGPTFFSPLFVTLHKNENFRRALSFKIFISSNIAPPY